MRPIERDAGAQAVDFDWNPLLALPIDRWDENTFSVLPCLQNGMQFSTKFYYHQTLLLRVS